MKADWREVLLGKVAEIAAGQGAPQGDHCYGKHGYPFVRAGSLDNLTKGMPESSLEHIEEPVAIKHRLRLFPKNTILFAKSGMSATKGLVYRLKHPCYVVSHLATVIPSINLDPSFLVYWLILHSPARLIRDPAYPSVRLSDIGEIRVPLPPLPDQRRIAAILDKADAIRRRRQEAVRCLTNLKPSIFRDMFGNVVRNSKHWPTTRLGEVCDSRLGKMLDAKQQTGKHRRPYLRNANVQWNHLDLSEVLEMDFDEKDCKIFRLRYGDVLICEGGEVGRAALWHDQLPECYFQKALHRVRPDPTKMTSEYIVNLMWFYAHNGGFKNHVTSATIAHLTGVKLKEIVLPIPPLSLQKEFVARVRQIMKLESEQVESIHHQDDLFNSLVQRAFRGELKSTEPELVKNRGGMTTFFTC